jgi:ABC-2 type transport system permease protein
MNTVSTFIVLLCSAVGGSMVPRFMMPDWLQGLGRFTPNHWAIEAMYGILARGQTLSDLLVTWLILFGCSAAAICLTIMISHKLRRL